MSNKHSYEMANNMHAKTNFFIEAKTDIK